MINDLPDRLVEEWNEENKSIIPMDDETEADPVKSDFIDENYLGVLRGKYNWFNRAMTSPNNRTKDNSTVSTAVEFVPDYGWILFPTIREVKQTGELTQLSLDEAKMLSLERGDFIPIKDMDEGNRLSEGLSKAIERESWKQSQNIPTEDSSTGRMEYPAGGPVQQGMNTETDIVASQALKEAENASSQSLDPSPIPGGSIQPKDVQNILDGISAIIGAGDIGSEDPKSF